MALHNLLGALNLEATQQALLTALGAVKNAVEALNAKVTAVNTGAVTVANQISQPLTDTQLRATAVPVSGTVSTGLAQPLTDAQLRATAVPVSGTVSTGLSQPLTDTQLRATAVPVSTGLAQPLTDTQLRAADVKVSLDGEQVSIANFPSTQPVTVLELPLPVGASTEETAVESRSLLQRLLNLFSSPPGYDAAQNRGRVTAAIESGTVTTVTTVTTVSTVSAIDSYQGRLLVWGQDQAAWAECVRARIS